MPALLLDTSTERGFIAIAEGEAILYSTELPFGLQNAHYILPEIEAALKAGGWKLEKMAYVAVGIGPGSYTGIRVGATVAKTLSFSSSLPLIGVCTLDAFIPEEGGVFGAVIDAKVGGVYLQTARLDQGIVCESSGPKVCQMSEAIVLLEGVDTLVTPNAAQLKPKVERTAGEKVWHWVERYPSPAYMAIAAQQKKQRQEFSLNADLDLLYLRKTQAEIEREKYG